MTVGEFFGYAQFDIIALPVFKDNETMAYRFPKPVLMVSKSLENYIVLEWKAGGNIDFVKDIPLSCHRKTNPLFDPIWLKEQHDNTGTKTV